MREHISRQKKTTTGFSIPSLKQPIRGFGLESSAISRQAIPEIQRLHKPLTHDISRIPLRTQAKLSISQPGDIYEQQADSVAQQVMQRMAQPVNHQSIHRVALPESEELQMKPLANSITPLVQREALPESEELQMKPLANSITPLVQRQEVPEDEEELQMKSLDNNTLQREALPEDEEELQMKPMVQRQAGMAGAPNLEASINQARGGGVAIADNIREPMEQAFGADFSGVKVHTDGQSDQLNRSIQARAFTTGQDVFFRQGEYNPGSRGGQELLAHELTHVVQQSVPNSLYRNSDNDDDGWTTVTKDKKNKEKKTPEQIAAEKWSNTTTLVKKGVQDRLNQVHSPYKWGSTEWNSLVKWASNNYNRQLWPDNSHSIVVGGSSNGGTMKMGQFTITFYEGKNMSYDKDKKRIHVVHVKAEGHT